MSILWAFVILTQCFTPNIFEKQISQGTWYQDEATNASATTVTLGSKEDNLSPFSQLGPQPRQASD